jgi:membrane protease YdiL (CAAX protease family)
MKYYRSDSLVRTIIELILILLFTRIVTEAFRHFTVLGAWESNNHLNFSFGWAFIIVSYAMLSFHNILPKDVALDVSSWPKEINKTAYLIATSVRLPIKIVFIIPILLLLSFFIAGLAHQNFISLIKLFSYNIFAVAIGEEIFFRGYAQGMIFLISKKKYFGISVSCIISAFLFSFIHLFNSSSFFNLHFNLSFIIAIQTLIAGLIYGFIRDKSGSIVPGYILHVLLNLCSFTLLPEFTNWVIRH